MAAANDPTATGGMTGDYETRGAEVDHQDLRLWLRMMALQKLVVNELRRRLRVSFGISIARFDLMSQLDLNQTGMRIGELSDRLMVTTGNITGLVDELVGAGLVRRMADPTSRRASLVRLTPKAVTLYTPDGVQSWELREPFHLGVNRAFIHAVQSGDGSALVTSMRSGMGSTAATLAANRSAATGEVVDMTSFLAEATRA